MEEQGHICMNGKLDSCPRKNGIPCLGFLGMSLQGDLRAMISGVLGEMLGPGKGEVLAAVCVQGAQGPYDR